MTVMIRKPIAGTVPPLQSGTTAQRPAPLGINQTYFDNSLGYQVTVKQVSPAIWVDGAGVQV